MFPSNVRQIVIPYTPRPQLAHIHNEIECCEESCLIIHRRAGKTVLLLNHIIKKALMFPGDDGEFAYVAPFLKQAKRIAWKYLKKYTSTIPGRIVSESELTITLPNGSRIGLFGSNNPEALRGVYLDGAVLDEFAQIDPDVYESILSPALMDRNGWVVFSGTPNGKNALWLKLMELRQDPEAYTFVLPASKSGILSPEQLKKALKRCRTQEKYDREYECSFDSVAGKKIYNEFNYNIHVAKEPLKPGTPVNIIMGIDNTGLNPAWVLTYFTGFGQWRVFKEFVFRDTMIMDATEAVLFWCSTNLHQLCTYEFYADPAGKTRDSNKMSARDYIIIKAREMGHDIMIYEGIQTPDVRWGAVSGRLNRISQGEPAILIDPEACPILVEGFMGAYCYKELAGQPGLFLKKADKQGSGKGHADVHDALQYPATRLFVTHDGGFRAGNAPDSYDDDDDFVYEGYNEKRTGRSTIAGY